MIVIHEIEFFIKIICLGFNFLNNVYLPQLLISSNFITELS